jgi:hypothetical protein
MMMSDQNITIGPLFTNALLQQGNIISATFSFAMQGFSSDISSVIDFGAPNPSRVSGSVINNNNSVTLGFNDDFYWSTTLQAISFGPEQSF